MFSIIFSFADSAYVKIVKSIYLIEIEYIYIYIYLIDASVLKYRINLTFWDELAHVAFQHVEKGHQIYVSGRLVTDRVETDKGKQQTYYKVL